MEAEEKAKVSVDYSNFFSQEEIKEATSMLMRSIIKDDSKKVK